MRSAVTEYVFGMSSLEAPEPPRTHGSEKWQASLARTLWRGPLPTTKHDRFSEYLPLWWGPVVHVHPGDEIVLLPTPIGDVIDEVRPAGGWEVRRPG